MDVNIFTLFATCFGTCSAIFTETIQIQQLKSLILMYRATFVLYYDQQMHNFLFVFLCFWFRASL
jgi:hypothetical protein